MKHGLRHHPHYKRWTDINDRCYKPSHKAFHHYGGRGIGIHPDWRKEAGPKAFCDHLDANLGPCPEGMTLDRKNNDLGYEPGNLRWATRRQQNENRRSYKKKSNLPVGVYSYRKRFKAQIWVAGKNLYLGLYDTPEQASEIFQFAKRQLQIYESGLKEGNDGPRVLSKQQPESGAAAADVSKSE